MERRVRKIMSLIEADIRRERTLDELSEIVNLSPSRLRHLFVAVVGITPAQYRRRLQMQEAKRLADETFLSVKQIMAQLGISSESQFARDFKRVHGMTLTQYRTRQHEGTSG